jgi:hypothetical protein
MPGEGGLIMCTWPKGGAESAVGKSGDAGFAGYFNECMTGFGVPGGGPHDLGGPGRAGPRGHADDP